MPTLPHGLLPHTIMMDDTERHAECSKTIRRVMLALTGVSVFCLLTLGQSDAALLGAGEVDSRPRTPKNPEA